MRHFSTRTSIAFFLLMCLLIPPTLGVFAAIAEEPSINGKIAFETDHDGNVEIYTMNPDGSGQTRLTNNNYYDGEICWSPDGTKIAFVSDRDGNYEIYVMNADGSGQTRLTTNVYDDGEPDWSPNGTKIVFDSDRDDWEIYVMNADGSGQTMLTDNDDGNAAWSPDGTKIAFVSYRDGNPEICTMNADGSGQNRLTTHSAEDWNPRWSPDGSKIAWDTNRDGNYEIYVMNADGSGQTRLTNTGTNGYPDWSPDGTQIVFDTDRDGNWEIYVMNADGSEQTRITNTNTDEWDPVWQRLYLNHFQQNGIGPDFTGSVLIVDGSPYTAGQLPASSAWTPGTSHTFSWSSPLAVSGDKRYVWSSTSGLSTEMSGTFIATSGDDTMTADYTTQYYVTFQTPQGGSIDQPSGWYNASGAISVSATPSQGYAFTGWGISGSLSMSGAGENIQITVNGPGSVSANFEAIDLVPPSITAILPANGSTSTAGSMTISASFSDNVAVDPSSVVLKVDGNTVTPGATVTAAGITYNTTLAAGSHSVELTVEDTAGNPRTAAWAFTVQQPAAGFPMEYILAVIAVIAVIAVLIFFLARRKPAAKPS